MTQEQDLKTNKVISILRLKTQKWNDKENKNK